MSPIMNFLAKIFSPHLVCAYDSEQKCSKILLQGSIPLTEFNAKLDNIAKDEEIIFYCG